MTELSTAPDRKRPRTWLGILLGVVGLLLVIVIVLLIVLLTRLTPGTNVALIGATGSPTASQAPTGTAAPATTTPTPTAAPQHTTAAAPAPAQPTGPAFAAFGAGSAVKACSVGPYVAPAPNPIQVTWSAVRASSAWIVQGTSDAANAKYMKIPLKGNQSNFPYEIDFNCNDAKEVFTITIVGTNGQHLSKSWIVKNETPGAEPVPRT